MKIVSYMNYKDEGLNKWRLFMNKKVLLVIVLAIIIIAIILVFVFTNSDKDENINIQNFARSYIIFLIMSIVLYFIIL